jgi:hypothetical protein
MEFLNLCRRGELTLDEEYNFDHPYANCYRCNNPRLVPNGETGRVHER